jgi:tetratricopeptide (TPR) repeat protein
VGWRYCPCTSVIKSGRETSRAGLALAFNARARTYRRKGEYDRAIQDYSKTIELNPKQAHAYIDRGMAFKQRATLLLLRSWRLMFIAKRRCCCSGLPSYTLEKLSEPPHRRRRLRCAKERPSTAPQGQARVADWHHSWHRVGPLTLLLTTISETSR